jgi:hypothetical protein
MLNIWIMVVDELHLPPNPIKTREKWQTKSQHKKT